ncbi:MAG: PmoA family protein [Mariniblastus sp.]
MYAIQNSKFLSRATFLLLSPFFFLVSFSGSNSIFAQETKEAVADAKATAREITFVKSDKKLDVKIGDELFTTFDYGTYKKPILYPVLGPEQIGMTRNWPMKKDVEGEEHDHVHHKSMWISHEINGVHFWTEKGGDVKTTLVETKGESFKEDNAFRATSSWVRASDGETLLTDQTTYRFGADETSRWIDCTVEYHATHGDFQFDDTKEGLFAIRTHPDLRLSAKPKSGVEKVFGKAVNSEGVSGKDIWGKPAKWLYYFGTIDDVPMGIAMYDHPDNLRHPTTWHARDYGLVTANPFGMHHFLGKEKGAGSFKVKNGDSLKLRYRIDFIKGNPSVDEIEKRFESFSSKE